MGLSGSFIDRHIAKWEKELEGPRYPHRAKWPSRLFHHSPLENAVNILKAGTLLSRNDSTGVRPRDVAATGVIGNSIRAHKFARLYFRPRTPTQYHIEGIRKVGECPFGESAHAPVLIMFVLDAKRILSMQGACFSDENMQTGTVEQCSEAYFDQIPFAKVYHEGGTGGDTSITKHRCAEVLATSPLDVSANLQWVYCRSEAERQTLVYALGPHASRWSSKIIVSDDLKVFEKRFTFVESVSLSNAGVLFNLSARCDFKSLSFEMGVFNSIGQTVGHFKQDDLASSPPSGHWIAKVKLKAGNYRIKIKLEQQEAYDAVLRLDLNPF